MLNNSPLTKIELDLVKNSQNSYEARKISVEVAVASGGTGGPKSPRFLDEEK